MAIRVAINGYGRIGRNILRALYESGRNKEIEIVAINDLGNAETNAHLTRYDTVHGRFRGEVLVDGDNMIVNGDKIRVVSNRDPSQLPWAELGVDVVHECTGFFTSKEKASAHLKAGAKKVIISAPGGKDVDATIVFGVNEGVLKVFWEALREAMLAPLALVSAMKASACARKSSGRSPCIRRVYSAASAGYAARYASKRRFQSASACAPRALASHPW